MFLSSYHGFKIENKKEIFEMKYHKYLHMQVESQSHRSDYSQ